MLKLVTVDSELPLHSVRTHLTSTKLLGIIVHIFQVILCRALV